MRLFARLRDILSPPKPSQTEKGYQIPFGLTPPEWAALKSLKARPEWEIYLKALDECCIIHYENLLISAKDEPLHFYRGKVQGLRKAGTIVDEAVLNEAQWKHEQSQRNRPTERTGRSLALFGSPAWSKPSESAAHGRR